MMQFSGGTASVLPPRAPGSLEPDYSTRSIYRDSIRRVSVSSGLCTSARFFLPTGGDTASSAGEGAYCWSSASSASWDASAGWSSVSQSFSSDGDLCFSDWGAADPDGDDELRAIARQMVHDGCMKGLIRGFSAGRSSSSSSAHYGCLGPDSSASREELLLLGSWFSELDVEWVLPTGQGDRTQLQLHLHLEDGCASIQDLTERWIKALKTMVQVLRITQLDLRAKKKPAAGNGIWHFMLLATGKTAEHEQEVAQFTRFAEVSLLRMLDFVDAVADAALNDDHSPETLPGMLQVYTCVVDDSPTVLSLFDEASSTTSTSTSTSMFEAMNDVFLRKRNKLSDAIRSMIEKVTVSFLRDRCIWTASLEEAGGVHKTTMLMMNYVMFLSRIEGALSFGLHDSSPVVNLIKDVISCLEKQLERTSNLISDPGLRYLYLMNNYSFISKKVSSLLLPPWTLMEDYKIEKPRKRDSVRRLPPMEDYVNQPDPNLRAKIETDSNLDGLVKTQSFIEAYLDASWEPVMSCLNHAIPHGFLRCGRALDKFESEFQRTYAMQKHWKVPNPELRKRLRKAIIEKVIPGYSKHLAEQTAKWKSIRQPKNTPLELEQLLEELFEG
ncbi:exocyst complex component EXO70B1 [Setaria italica]|uniref:exocyst complex component EXO70B1 n=1 Tax=Setaria italica TaxID=4555 RepID=UPI000647C80B|nr:exocyst complex component EXO70B1 [Setaria italica]